MTNDTSPHLQVGCPTLTDSRLRGPLYRVHSRARSAGGLAGRRVLVGRGSWLGVLCRG